MTTIGWSRSIRMGVVLTAVVLPRVSTASRIMSCLPIKQTQSKQNKTKQEEKGKDPMERQQVCRGWWMRVVAQYTHTHARASPHTHVFLFPTVIPNSPSTIAPPQCGGMFDDDDGSLSLPAAIRPDIHRVQPHKKRGRWTFAIVTIAVQQNLIHGGGCRDGYSLDGSADGRQETILSA